MDDKFKISVLDPSRKRIKCVYGDCTKVKILSKFTEFYHENRLYTVGNQFIYKIVSSLDD